MDGKLKVKFTTIHETGMEEEITREFTSINTLIEDWYNDEKCMMVNQEGYWHIPENGCTIKKLIIDGKEIPQSEWAGTNYPDFELIMRYLQDNRSI
jgi:hypothetical protein